MKTSSIWILGVAGVILSLGCASKPEQELAMAEKAREQAVENHASEFATADWQSAEEAMNEAKDMIAKENYGPTRTILLRAKSRYEKARDIAKGKRDDLLREIQGIEKTIDIRYKALRADLDLSQKKLSASQKESLKNACEKIDQGIEKLKGQVTQGEYTPAKFTAQTTIRDVWEAEKELRAAAGGKK